MSQYLPAGGSAAITRRRGQSRTYLRSSWIFRTSAIVPIFSSSSQYTDSEVEAGAEQQVRASILNSGGCGRRRSDEAVTSLQHISPPRTKKR